MAEKTSVFLNGRFVGYAANGERLTEELRDKRRKGQLERQVNVAHYPRTNEIFINTDDGRARRPLIVVKRGKSMLTEDLKNELKDGKTGWNDLIQQGVIEYLDAEEEENTYIAKSESDIDEKHTHLEIDAVGILGYVSAQLPFPEHDASPRILMASQHAKQSLGLYASNFNLRMETRGYLLSYPQEPLAQTRVYDTLNSKRRSSGQNFVVAILSWRGYNMNDAIVLNKGSVERAIGRSFFLRSYNAEERRYPGGQKDSFGKPEEFVQGYLGEESYTHLDKQGFIDPETTVKGDTVLVGKTSPPRFLREISALEVEVEKRRESSVTTRGNEEGIVDALMLSETTAGNRMVKIRARTHCVPEIGDKFASRHGQKGVVALLVPHADMPFTKSGIVPDLILNPHAIPSRMTAGHLIEMLAGKAASLDGMNKDATPFSGDAQEELEKIVQDHGFKYSGEEVMYDGVTGEMMAARIYIGVVYYQRLHHLVSLKMHARSRGPIQMLTHQPTEGRAREGGLRLGEMERDCFIGFGTASLLKERFIESSDKTTELVCSDCGALGVFDKIKNRRYCPLCDSSNVYEVEMSYAFKLLLDEMKSMGIFPKLNVREKGW